MAEEALEERVRILEEQVAALSVAPAASAEPSGYYVSKRSGEEIDALLDKVEAMG